MLVARGAIRPDLILADYNLPKGLNGLQLTTRLREKLRYAIPAIILTGDISTDTLRDIARDDIVQLNKPVKLKDLTQAVQRLLARPHAVPIERAPPPAEAAGNPGRPVIFVVDDDDTRGRSGA
jgi:two-component system CheB/CheR fusion protein